MQSRSSAPEYLPALTGLRFLLALWVILHHIAGRGMMLESWTNARQPETKKLVLGGYLAVQTFFLLSGFVLAKSYARSTWTRHDVIRYVAARFARIYPVYILSLTVVSPFIFGAMMRPTRSLELKAKLLFLYAFVLQGWAGDLGVGWNTPAWTLSCEFFFYLWFPFLFFGLRRAGKWTTAGVVVLTIVFPVLLAHAGVPWTWKPIHHLSDFAAGIAAARIYDFLGPRFRGYGAWLYLPALVMGAVLITHPELMEGTYGDVNTGLRPLNVMALVGLALEGGFGARWLAGKSADFLGKASYSMYILHVPVLWWYNQWAHEHKLHLPGPAAAALFITIVMTVSSVSFLWVEVPVNRWLRVRVNKWLASH